MEERITPKMFLNHMLARHGAVAEDLDIGPLVIGSWDRDFISSFAEEVEACPIPFWPQGGKGYNWKSGNRHITLVTFPVGAPSAVTTLEFLIACGAKAVVGIGFTGSLQPSLPIGSFVFADTCLREEGTSYHYIQEDSEIKAGPGLLGRLEQLMAQEDLKYEKGCIWTTDAIFRELKSKISDYGRRGVLGVEMETSAMYAVGRFRKVEVCNLLIVSDELWDRWNPQLFGSKKMLQALNTLKRAFIKNIDALAAGFEPEAVEVKTKYI